jgi:hypothetical protein
MGSNHPEGARPAPNHPEIGDLMSDVNIWPDALPAGAPLWVAETGCLDAECYSQGTESTVSVHATREGAVAAVRARFAEVGVAVPALLDADGDNAVAGEFTEADRFEWTWNVYRVRVRV